MFQKVEIPTKVFLMFKCGAMAVGGLADRLAGVGERGIKDYDLIVPPDKWYAVSLLIPGSARLNKHGGLKFVDECGNMVDVWPSSVEQYFRHCSNGFRTRMYVIDYINSMVFVSYTVGEQR